MGFKVEHQRESGASSLDIYLNGIVKESEKTEREVLRSAGEELKRMVETNLLKYKRTTEKRYKGRPALADDVVLTIRKGKNGITAARVQGGKATGTLWHIVNDGTLHTNGNHFLDNALASLDKEVDKILDKVIK